MRQRRNGIIIVMICILGFLGVFPGLDILDFMLRIGKMTFVAILVVITLVWIAAMYSMGRDEWD